MLAPPLLDALLDRTLEEDLAGGDLTTQACVEPDARAVGEAVARRPLVVCGGPVFRRLFERLEPAAAFASLVDAGNAVPVGAGLWRVGAAARADAGAARSALPDVERVGCVGSTDR